MVYLQRCLIVRPYGWCYVKLLPFRRLFCVHHSTMHPFTESLQSHTGSDLSLAVTATGTFGRMTEIFYVLLR